MKKADKKELKMKSVSELQKHLQDGYEILAQLRMDNIQSKLKNTRSITNTRKDIAVIKTMIVEKSYEPEEQKEPVEKKKEEKPVKKTKEKEEKGKK